MSKLDVTLNVWPNLPFDVWQGTRVALHMWMQIIGKIRLAQAPPINHWWQVPLYVTSRGLTTSSMPYEHRTFQIDFDFIDHQLKIYTSDGLSKTLALETQSVAEFYHRVMAILRELEIEISIWTTPVEVENPIPFEQNRDRSNYNREHAEKFWQILVQVDRVFTEFRSRFIGKVSPVHFFWGSFDMALTRFSGRVAPKHPGAPGLADFVTHEAYSHEVSSCGFWFGNGFGQPAFYSYAYPNPSGFEQAVVRPDTAFFSSEIGEFVLPYDAVRQAENPDEVLLDFLQTTYAAAADLAKWDRTALEKA